MPTQNSLHNFELACILNAYGLKVLYVLKGNFNGQVITKSLKLMNLKYTDLYYTNTTFLNILSCAVHAILS